MHALLALSRYIQQQVAAHDAKGTPTRRAEPVGRKASATAQACGSPHRELASGQGSTTAMASSPVQAPRARLEGLDHVLQTVVKKCKGPDFTSKHVYAAIRNLKYTIENQATCAALVDIVLTHLIDWAEQPLRPVEALVAAEAGRPRTLRPPPPRACAANEGATRAEVPLEGLARHPTGSTERRLPSSPRP